MLSGRLRNKLDDLASGFARRSRLKYQSKVRKLPSLKVQTTELRKQIAELERERDAVVETEASDKARLEPISKLPTAVDPL